MSKLEFLKCNTRISPRVIVTKYIDDIDNSNIGINDVDDEYIHYEGVCYPFALTKEKREFYEKK